MERNSVLARASSTITLTSIYSMIPGSSSMLRSSSSEAKCAHPINASKIQLSQYLEEDKCNSFNLEWCDWQETEQSPLVED